MSELFSDFTARMLERALMEYRKTDTEYQEIDSYLTAHTARYNKMVESLGDEEQAFMAHYMDMKIQSVRSVNEGMYIAGYRDCVKLLRHLGVL